MFTAEFGRPPMDARELSGHVARLSKPRTTAVAGFDLTFSPVKSVSAVWALVEPPVAAVIERAHNAAVADALSFIEREALFTREGAGGVRQVDVRGLVGVAFTHRDSRAGDPDLHTHVAVANKVQTLAGRWLAIDGRVLYKAVVSASQVYNTSLERRLAEGLGLVFADRASDARTRPVREIVGVPPELLALWSTRRASITRRAGELARAFQDDHGRAPTPVEKIALAQQATLETRQGKHPPRTVAEQRRTWHAGAESLLGGPARVQRVLREIFGQAEPDAAVRDDAWYTRVAGEIVEVVEQSRATWQVWHVRGEASHRARCELVPVDEIDAVVTRLVAVALGDHSVPLAGPVDPIEESPVLRRRSGSSVYSVAGAPLFTSRRILDAEARLVHAAGQVGGFRANQESVNLAVLECAAHGVELNDGQRRLVEDMATSGRRVQLGIAPAGSGKTTAMQALCLAWQDAGGTVVGLAPSAAAADALRQYVPATTETLAKLTWSLSHAGVQPAWVRRIGARTLVIIDEAGMADTASLNLVVQHVLGCGGSVRLIGDDQQLAAIGSGGVLRDIATTHGALRLHELIRFADPGEAAASIALRDGRPEAIGFYLDRGRVHIGDQATCVEDLFAAWTSDRREGLDSIMLAPTRDLVADLNHRAREQRLEGTVRPARETPLSDGNLASVGDVVISRTNNRKLRTGAADWVKNGDRWRVEQVRRDGSLRVRHLKHRHQVVLPADYVANSIELGYATTIHTAQGVSVDTTHGLATGSESRQQLYTMLTRGRHTNHVYVQLVDDGDPHSLIKPDTIAPPTPTELLERVLAVDEAPVSARTEQRQSTDPATLLGIATGRYKDALGFAAEAVLAGPLAELEQGLSATAPWLVNADSWPALRTRLALVAADGQDPLLVLAEAVHEAPLADADDPAAVVTWRIDATQVTAEGPLPWLAPVPDVLRADPAWGGYLIARAEQVAHLAEVVRTNGRDSTVLPAWTAEGALPNRATIADIEVWRAANQVPTSDLRPTGAPQREAPAARCQRRLQRRLAPHLNAALDEWLPLLESLSPRSSTDPFTVTLARRLGQLSTAGIDVRRLLLQAVHTGPLPDDHPAAALWWRISSRVDAPFVAQLERSDAPAATWADQLQDLLGPARDEQLRGSPWWPALVTVIGQAIQRGWQLTELLREPDEQADGDPCQTLVRRTSILTHPPADEEPPEPPERMAEPEPIAIEDEAIELELEQDEVPDLTVEAIFRRGLPQPSPTDAQIREQLARADAWRESGTTPERLAWINEQAARFYCGQFPDSWARPYLAERLGTDLTDHPDVRPGYAPAGWTTLITHLRTLGVTDHELLVGGLARRTSTGRLVDQFRDRFVLPIVGDNAIIGFTARANPDLPVGRAGPKYLNTPTTPLFHKGDQLYRPSREPGSGALTVLVEGALDAIAIDLATAGAYVGVAPLGTALTEPQAAELAALSAQPIIATDNDPAGQRAAERDYWLLSLQHADALHATLPSGADPAALLAANPRVLTDALCEARPLADTLIQQRLATGGGLEAVLGAIQVIAARRPEEWLSAAQRLAAHSNIPMDILQQALHGHIQAWNNDPRRAAHTGDTWRPDAAVPGPHGPANPSLRAVPESGLKPASPGPDR